LFANFSSEKLMDSKKRLTKNTTSVGFILLVATIVLWFVAFYQPYQRKVAISKKQVQQWSRRLSMATVSEVALQQLEVEVDTLENNIVKIEEKIYPLKQMQQIGQQLINYSSNYHLRMLSMVPDYEVLFSLKEMKSGVRPMIKLPVTFVMRGRYKNFGKFAENIHTLPFAFAIDEVRLDADPVIYPELNIQMKGFFYLLTEEKTAASTAKSTM